MKYAFYPGCVSRGGCPELYPAAIKVAARLGIELEELKDVACNGAGVLPQYISDLAITWRKKASNTKGRSRSNICCGYCSRITELTNSRPSLSAR